MRILFKIMILLSVAQHSYAGLNGAVDALYLSDNFTTATTVSNSTTYYGVDIVANLDQKSRFYAGFHAHQFYASDTRAGTTTSLSSLDMGPFIKWVIDQKKVFALSASYNFLANGIYQNAGVSSELTGTSILASFDVTPEISEDIFVGVRLNYYAISYSKSTASSVATGVAYSRNVIFPTLSISWRK